MHDIKESGRRLKYFVKRKVIPSGTGENYIGLENIESWTGNYIESTEEYVPDGSSLSVSKGDVLFGKLRPYLAKCYIAEKDASCSSEFIVMQAQECSAKFLKWFMLCPDTIDKINMSTYGAKMPRANWSFISDLKFPDLSIEAQDKIAHKLNELACSIDKLISNQQAQIEKLKQYKQSLITEVVTKGLDSNALMKDSGVEWIGHVPASWHIERGKALFQETDARSVDGSEELLTVSQYTGITPRSQKNVNMFEALTLEGYKICEVGDIAANTMWLWAGAIGVSEYRGVISPSYNVYRQKGENFIPKYLDYLLRAPLLVQEYASRSTGIRASRLRLYPQDFFEILFPIPPKEEQAEMVKFLEDKFAVTDQLIAIKEAKIEKLQKYKKSLIYEYVTGKKEVV